MYLNVCICQVTVTLFCGNSIESHIFFKTESIIFKQSIGNGKIIHTGIQTIWYTYIEIVLKLYLEKSFSFFAFIHNFGIFFSFFSFSSSLWE